MRTSVSQGVCGALFIGAVALVFLPGVFSAPLAEEGPRTVSIVIRDSQFMVRGGGLRPNEPAVIILRNEDKIQHGFKSEVFETLDARVEGHGVITYGRGIQGLYIKRKEGVRILFTPTHSGEISFRCDLHPKMKGELLVILVGAV